MKIRPRAPIARIFTKKRVDLFAGGGGVSEAFKRALGRAPDHGELGVGPGRTGADDHRERLEAGYDLARAQKCGAFLAKYGVKLNELGLATVTIDDIEYIVADIGMRMLEPRELFRATGFYDDYQIAPIYNGKPLTRTAQIRMCGNAVPPAKERAEALAFLADVERRLRVRGERLGSMQPERHPGHALLLLLPPCREFGAVSAFDPAELEGEAFDDINDCVCNAA